MTLNSFALHPNVYATGQTDGLMRMLEHIWVRDFTSGQGTIYIISGFGMYNGGLRFYKTFEDHVKKGGKIVSFFAGSTSQRLTSKQLVEGMLQAGAEVNVINRKRLLHAKCYGTSTEKGDRLIVTSGNFTGAGMSLNAEASVLLDVNLTCDMNFSWKTLETNLKNQTWNRYLPSLINPQGPWQSLLYNEIAHEIVLDDTEGRTLLVTLSHADTARIQATPGSNAGKGTQYFWLSKDSYGFFPPLTIRNKRGTKATFQCLITLHLVNLQKTVHERVTFEAENNFDFRLSTKGLRYTQIAQRGDLAAISRTGEDVYEIRIFQKNTATYNLLFPYTINLIGHKGKQYGYVDNDEFTQLTKIDLPSVPLGGYPKHI